LTANKTKLYKLVAEFEPLPPMRRVTFIKSYRRTSYWLRWGDRNGIMCEAFFAPCGGRPALLIKKRAFCGKVISSVTHGLNVEDLAHQGMVEEIVTKVERQKSPRRNGRSERPTGRRWT